MKQKIMHLVKTKPRYRCDFCRTIRTKEAMVAHEQRCWRNPDRFCVFCENTGLDDQYLLGQLPIVQKDLCRYCRPPGKLVSIRSVPYVGSYPRGFVSQANRMKKLDKNNDDWRKKKLRRIKVNV